MLPIFLAGTPAPVAHPLPQKQAAATVSVPPVPAAQPPARTPEAGPRPSRRPPGDHLSTPSIRGMLQDIQASAVAEPVISFSGEAPEPNRQSFTPDRLVEKWKAFAETVEAAQLKAALLDRDPQLCENWRIEYNLDNEVQKQRITLDLKPMLLGYLQRELNNDVISIDFMVSENHDEILNKPYTDQEKFNVMGMKYPVLLQIKQRFGLDFE